MRRECRSVDEFEKVDRISEGTYGVVYRAREKATGAWMGLRSGGLPSDDIVVWCTGRGRKPQAPPVNLEGTSSASD